MSSRKLTGTQFRNEFLKSLNILAPRIAAAIERYGEETVNVDNLVVTGLTDIISDATTDDVFDITADSLTTADVIDISADALTTGGILNLVSDSPDTSVRVLVDIHNDNTAATQTIPFRITNDAAGQRRDMQIVTATTIGDVLDINCDSLTTGHAIDVSADGLTTGGILNLVSDSSDNTVRDLVTIKNDNTAATNTTLLHLINDSTSAVADVIIESTDAGAISAPILEFLRSSSSPADEDVMGEILFSGKDDAGNITVYAAMRSEINDQTNSGGEEDGVIIFDILKNANRKSALELKNNEAVFNNSSQDIDFRIESDDETHMFFIDANNNRISIGDSTDDPAAILEITNHASAGATGAPLVQLNSNDVDQIGLDINAANTTANVIDITADAVTTATVLNISADALTTGKVIRAISNSSDNSTRTAFSFANTNSSASGTIVGQFFQSAIETCLAVANDNAETDFGPILNIVRSSTTVADNMGVGFINFQGYSDAGNYAGYARISAEASDVSNSTTRGKLILRAQLSIDGSEPNAVEELMSLGGGTGSDAPEVVINDLSYDVDFRVETNATTHALFVDGGSDHVRIDAAQGLHLKDLGTHASTPASGFGVIYVNGDVPYFKTDGGTATSMIGGGGGSPGGSDTQIQYNNGGSFGGVASLTFDDSSGHLTIIDDKKLQFGTNNDASFEYDEDGTNTLLYAGAHLRISDDVNLQFGTNGDAFFFYDEASTDKLLYGGATLQIDDDTKLEFGQGGDASFEYDENGTDRLLYTGAGLRFTDDVKLEFGTGGDATIEYDEDGDDVLLINGAATKFTVAGVEIENGSSTGAPALKIDNDDTDQAALFIEAANINQDVIIVNADALTTEKVIDISADGLTTGAILNLVSDSSDTSTRSLVNIVNDNSAATAVTCLTVRNDSNMAATTPTVLIHDAGDMTSDTHATLELRYEGPSSGRQAMLEFNQAAGNSTDDDDIGLITATALNSADEKTIYSDINFVASDRTDGDEGGEIQFRVMAGGTAGTAALKELFTIGGEDVANSTVPSVIVNEAGINCDFRVESDAEDEAIFLDASAETLYINKGESAFTTQIHSTNDVAMTVGAAGVIFNEDGHATNDFRVESDSETHMLFVDSGNNRVSIGDSTDTPAATLEVNNANDAGVPLVLLDSNDTDQIALDINAANIDAHVVTIDANALTTGAALRIQADGLTTGGLLNLVSDSGESAARSLVKIHQDNASARQTSLLELLNDMSSGASPGGNALKISTAQLINNVIQVEADGLTTGTMLSLVSDSASTSSRTLAKIVNDNTAATDVTILELDNDAIANQSILKISTVSDSASPATILIEDANDPSSGFNATNAPNIGFKRTNTTTQDDQLLGAITFSAKDDAGNDTQFGFMLASSTDVSIGDACGEIGFYVINDGLAARELLTIGGADQSSASTSTPSVIVNEAGIACDFRVESDGNTNMLTVSGAKNSVAIGADETLHMDGFSVVDDFQATTFENTFADGEYGSSQILKYSPGADDTLTAGQLFFLNTDGTWDAADADAVTKGATQLLGIGLGGSARTVGCLIKGFIRIPSTEILNVPGAGAVDGLPVYVSTTGGHFDFTAPSGNGDFVRIVGYAIDDDGGDVLIYFDPDKTHVEITA